MAKIPRAEGYKRPNPNLNPCTSWKQINIKKLSRPVGNNKTRIAGAGKELMGRENVGNLWDKNQHIPQIFPTCSPLSAHLNILATIPPFINIKFSAFQLILFIFSTKK